MITDYPWMGILIGLGAMAPFTVQAILFLRNQRRQRNWVRTSAVVLYTHVTSDSDGVKTYRASYNFGDTSGAARSGKGEIGHHAANGTEIPIVFDPTDPRRNQPYRKVGIGHWLAGSLGLLLFVAGVFGVAQGIHLMLTGRMLGD